MGPVIPLCRTGQSSHWCTRKESSLPLVLCIQGSATLVPPALLSAGIAVCWSMGRGRVLAPLPHSHWPVQGCALGSFCGACKLPDLRWDDAALPHLQPGSVPAGLRELQRLSGRGDPARFSPGTAQANISERPAGGLKRGGTWSRESSRERVCLPGSFKQSGPVLEHEAIRRSMMSFSGSRFSGHHRRSGPGESSRAAYGAQGCYGMRLALGVLQHNLLEGTATGCL